MNIVNKISEKYKTAILDWPDDLPELIIKPLIMKIYKK